MGRFEQKTVVREMITNYSQVSKEFHEKYRGLHSNRDKEWVNPDSFRMGQVVWPFSLRICISVIFMLVQIFYSVYELFERLRQTMFDMIESASTNTLSHRISMRRNQQ